ncbi:MAG: aminoacyl-histidine dipeptidase [Lachnospiraceae bacterium]|nr:aminoacyl-histidine dipeptidase [Lachnospiraceae bacterium]
MSVLNFEPKEVFSYFEEICSIPHGSSHTKQISDYLVSFAEKFNLTYVQEECGNVIIWKEATSGYENSPTVILQGHMDMVCEKEAGVSIDFLKEGLILETEGDFVFAQGTTLGGDDGIAIAYALAILASNEIPHPALEVVFTVDEEIGMLGANALDASVLKGKMLINIDSEEEGILTTSCAGGVIGEITLPFSWQPVEGISYELIVEGLQGGHSGVEIQKERANSNIVLGRVLYEISKEVGYGIEVISGGLKDNAIPRASRAVIWLDEENEEMLKSTVDNFRKTIKNEYRASDPEVVVKVAKREENQGRMIHPREKEFLLYILRNIPNGVQKMSMEIAGLVETSCNLGILKTCEESIQMEVSIRSSVESEKRELSDRIRYLTEFLGCDYEEKGDYAGWEYNPNSKLQKIMIEVFEKMYERKPEVEAIHAGLECGILSAKIPGLECISIGPDIFDIHTPKERLSISSSQRVWEYLLEVLKQMK